MKIKSKCCNAEIICSCDEMNCKCPVLIKKCSECRNWAINSSEERIYKNFADKHQLKIISIQDGYANFKEYDGDGYFKVRKTLKEVIIDLDLVTPSPSPRG